MEEERKCLMLSIWTGKLTSMTTPDCMGDSDCDSDCDDDDADDMVNGRTVRIGSEHVHTVQCAVQYCTVPSFYNIPSKVQYSRVE